jgi:hypothetical protein
VSHLLDAPPLDATAVLLRAAVGRLARAEGLPADGLALVLGLLDRPAPRADVAPATLAALDAAGLIAPAGADAVTLTAAGRALAVPTLAFLRTLLDEAARRRGLTPAELLARSPRGGA